jgi:hypothetical protein
MIWHMTENEARHQKAMLLLESQEAEQNLALLQEKAKRIANRLLAVVEWLENAGRSARTDSKFWSNRASGQIDIFGDPQIEIAMNLAEVKQVVSDIKAAHALTLSLNERKQALGLK